MDLIKEYVQATQIQPQKQINTHSKKEDDVVIIGRTSDLELFTYWNDPEHIPHFHFVNTKTGEKGALKFLAPEYCFHEDYTATLSKEQLEELHNYLNKRAFSDADFVEYDFMCVSWEKTNEKYFFKRPKLIPDYRVLS